jgi:hypothetical protein
MISQTAARGTPCRGLRHDAPLLGGQPVPGLAGGS